MSEPRFLVVGPPDHPTFQTDDMDAATDTARREARIRGVDYAVYTLLERFVAPAPTKGDRL